MDTSRTGKSRLSTPSRGLLLGCTLAAVTVGQSATWRLVQVPDPPPARSDAALALHPGIDRAVLFGGSVLGGTFLGDTWHWDGSTWTRGADGPPPRKSARMVWDTARERLVLFGGNDLHT